MSGAGLTASDAIVPVAAALVGITAIAIDPLYALPVAALAAWYAVLRIAAVPAALLPWAAVFSLLGDKMIVSTGLGGGTGVLRLGPLVSIALLGALLLVDAETRAAAADVVRWGSPAALFVLVGAVIPLVGTMLDYPPRTATATIVPLATAAFLVFGVRVTRGGADRDRVRYLMLAWVTPIAAAAGLLLFLRNRGVELPLAAQLHEWGLATAEAYGTTWLIGRSGGLYTSPNVFATLAGLALVFAAFGSIRPRQRLVLALPALLILFVTLSRGVMLGTAVAIAVGWLARTRRSTPLRWQTILLWSLALVVVVAGVIAAAAVFPTYVDALTGRLGSALRVLTEGAQADRNFAGRIAFWGSAVDLLQLRPLGTFGPPELLLGSAVDNDYLRFALQGGFLYAGAWLLYLAWLVITGLRDGADRFVGAAAIFLAVTALTQTPSTYVMVVGMFSLFVGMHIEQIRMRATGAPLAGPPQESGEG